VVTSELLSPSGLDVIPDDLYLAEFVRLSAVNTHQYSPLNNQKSSGSVMKLGTYVNLFYGYMMGIDQNR
jgi:hypothetical protein